MSKTPSIILPRYLQDELAAQKIRGTALLKFAHSCVYHDGQVIARSSYPIKPNDFQNSEMFKQEVAKRFTDAGYRVIWEA